MEKKKPRVGIFGLTSCAGDQLAILNCEDQLLTLAGALDIKSWVMAQTVNDNDCELDVAFVEGVVATDKDLEELKAIRERASILIAIGTCAVWGGVVAMKNHLSREKMRDLVYGKESDHINPQKALPVNAAVDVEYELPGCPIEKDQFLTLVGSLLHGDMPEFMQMPVCSECKKAENECLLIHKGEPCTGALTLSGCGARCPSLNIPCVGCHGPIEEAHYDANYRALQAHDISKDEIIQKMGIFASSSWVPSVLIKSEAEEQEGKKYA